MISPVVGSKVWYRVSKDDSLGPIRMSYVKDQPLDATIIAVWSDRSVSVLVTDIFGKQFPKLTIDLLQDDDKPKTSANGELLSGYVEWANSGWRGVQDE